MIRGDFINVEMAGVVPLFLIRYAQKNVGRGSTVSILENEIKTCLLRSAPDESEIIHFLHFT